MNASDYLRKQGWRGSGFSLDKSDRGLAKPLLVSHKSDQSGLGTKKNDFGNQWWNTAFEKSLKNIGSEEAAATALPHLLQVKQAALYSRFLKAETLVSDFKPPIQGSDLGTGKRKKQTGSSSAAEVDTMAGSGVRLTTGPILGVPANDTKEPVVEEGKEKKGKKERKEKKRKHDDGPASDVQEGPGREKRSKRSKGTKTQPISSAEEAVPPPAEEPTSSVGESVHLPHRVLVDQPAAMASKPKPERDSHKEVRARRKKQRAERSRENARRNKEQDEAEKAQAVADGTYVEPDHPIADLEEEVQAKRKAEKDAKRQAREEKQAKRQTKEQIKIERRTAKRLKRAEKKRENHMATLAHISAKLAQQRKVQDEAAATDAGMTYDVYIAHREALAESKKAEKHKAKAAELGTSYEQLAKNHERIHNGMPILGIEGAVQGETKAPTDSDDESSSEESSDESESASHDGILDSAAKASTSASNGTKSADIGADFIPLSDDPASDGAGFMIDTIGDATQAIDPDAPKKVKDMTKAERKARLEQMRERRAARKAVAGETTMSKKERRKRRALKKEEMINKMTNDLMDKARNEAKDRGDPLAIKQGQGKVERKKMREARRIMRGMKKGKIPQEELMEGWDRPGSRRDKPRLRGNGGREPKTRADLFR